ncbi:NTP transferase domain-containing protein [Aquibacillus albus]|uniref:Probable molybdenum cofactor guanylyltransferase n=1 Tax=Aquibacillus albus TaxID=1168171 RepID=A0ABS2MYM5_9BACI|nr:molybdopterin-guanine dinucleotide biosynthesis protein A [Aquibacillus albus]
MSKKNEVAGILLAGGQSRRFGSPKAFAERQGVPFYQYSLQVMTPFCSSVALVAHPEWRHLFRVDKNKITVIQDDPSFQGQGPLAGIFSGMTTLSANWYIILPVDVPFIEHWVLERLVSEIEGDIQAIIPVVSGKDQPLIAAYHCSVKNKIKNLLINGSRSMQSLLSEINVKKIEINRERAFININSRDDYDNHL